MTTIYDVAKWFLSKKSMTHKKLQKLCYYAQAWSMALFNHPLFAEDFQAWVHGPVAPALYPCYADYRWNQIPQQPFDDSVFPDDALNILDAVYNTYGDFSGDQLESLTHSEEPWKKARGDLNPWESSTTPVSLDDMRVYYGKQYEDAQND